jgi:catechol 2,3-dioxygenase-like lactoylglutathione lyase family enzyme
MLIGEQPPEGPHFCLAVDDLEGLRARLEAAGVATRDGTELLGRPRFTCRDPFGNVIELARIER